MRRVTCAVVARNIILEYITSFEFLNFIFSFLFFIFFHVFHLFFWHSTGFRATLFVVPSTVQLLYRYTGTVMYQHADPSAPLISPSVTTSLPALLQHRPPRRNETSQCAAHAQIKRPPSRSLFPVSRSSPTHLHNLEITSFKSATQLPIPASSKILPFVP